MGAFNDGKKSGVTAGDLTSAPDMGKVAPGRIDAPQSADDDLHWVLSLALDVAGAHVLGMAVKALQAAKAASVVKRGRDVDRRDLRQDDRGLHEDRIRRSQ